MSRITTRAIVLSRKKRGETSLAITLLTAQHGKVSGISKGALSAKSSLAATLDLLHEVEVVFTSPKPDAPAYFDQATLLDARPGLRRSYARFELGCYFADLISRALDVGHEAPELWTLLREALGYLETHEPSAKLMTRFEKKLMEGLGLAQSQEDLAPGHFATVFVHNFGALPSSRTSLLKKWPV